jgi:hypothetical protein
MHSPAQVAHLMFDARIHGYVNMNTACFAKLPIGARTSGLNPGHIVHDGRSMASIQPFAEKRPRLNAVSKPCHPLMERSRKDVRIELMSLELWAALPASHVYIYAQPGWHGRFFSEGSSGASISAARAHKRGK